jgi:hypothetical protein
MRAAESLDLFGPPSDPPLSEHIRNEIAAVFVLGRSLEPGEKVPGCGCVECGRFAFANPSRCFWCRR